MTETTYLEGVKNDATEMAQLLSEIPESKKECVLMLVRGFKLGMDSEKKETGKGGGADEEHTGSKGKS